MNIAIIPARGGSKRIPKKNIKNFCGKPMLSWPLEVALKSKLFDQVIISSDDDEIIDISKRYGGVIPFIRPKELSDDFSTSDDVMKHAAQWVKINVPKISNLCCIYATAAFLKTEDLTESFKLFNENSFNYVFSATDFASPIFRSFSFSKKDGLKMFYPEKYNTRSQDLPVAYHDAGMFYWASLETWIKQKVVFEQNSFPYLLPRWRVQDIDNTDDWYRAELIMKVLDS